jgi:hypothetical protein
VHVGVPTVSLCSYAVIQNGDASMAARACMDVSVGSWSLVSKCQSVSMHVKGSACLSIVQYRAAASLLNAAWPTVGIVR